MTTDGLTSDFSQSNGGGSDEGKKGLSGVLGRVEEKALDLGRNAVNAIDGKRGAAAESLAGAATQLHTGGDKVSHLAHAGAEKASHLAHGAADKLQASADYVRDHDLKAMVESVERFVRSNPGKALLTAGVVGFLAARALRTD